MPTKDKKNLLVGMFIVLFLFHTWGIYSRNYKIDSDFLYVITEQAFVIEKLYIDEALITMDDVNDFGLVMGMGATSKNSEAEIEIESAVLGMVDAIYKMSNARLDGDSKAVEKENARYLVFKEELRVIFDKLRKQRKEVEVLWEKGFFQ